MKPHSIKVPTQYRRAAQIFKQAVEEKKSLKNLIYEEKHAKVSKLVPLFKKYQENKDNIEQAIEESKILSENERFNPYLCKVLVTDLFFLTKKLNGESRPVQTVLEYKSKLAEYLGEISQCNESEDKPKRIEKPRYVRVNTNLYSVEEFITDIEAESWRRKTYNNDDYDDYLKAVSEIEEDEYIIDIHIKELIVFSHLTRKYWAGHDYVEKKKLFLQDKATCLVSKILNPPLNSTILDMCAAPGMKTIHLSNTIGNNGIIYAVEQNENRYKTLTSMVKSSFAKCVKPIMGDALQLETENYTDVEYILVDPSCSGSGMQNRISLEKDVKDNNRLWKLAGLQIKILQKALTDFPKVKRVVYSTCSIYPEENEQVIQKCLERCPNFKLLSGKKELRRLWKNTGDSQYQGIGKNCIYSLPDVDMTDGIFIALFERKKSSENN